MSKSYDIGFEHGNSANGTNGYKPSNRKSGGESFTQYGRGFQDGMMSHHEETKKQNEYLANLNKPKSQRA